MFTTCFKAVLNLWIPDELPYKSLCSYSIPEQLWFSSSVLITNPLYPGLFCQNSLFDQLIHSLSDSSFSSDSSEHLQSHTVRARDLKLWENVLITQPVTCHVSHVTCHMLYVTCHMSHVKCHFKETKYIFVLIFFLQIGGASGWRVCYQQGLLRLVL